MTHPVARDVGRYTSPGTPLMPLPAVSQPGLGGIRDLVFDRVGRHLYATGGNSYGGAAVYASLARDATTGTLGSRHTGTCSTTHGLSGFSCRTPAQIEISPDGRHAYILGDYHGAAAVTMLTRSRAGVLAPVRNGAIRALGNEVRSLALSADGRNVYVAVDDSIVPLDRARSGRLTRAKGFERCHTDRRTACPAPRGVVNAGGVALSADGRSVYVASEGGVAVFRRATRSGALRQLSGPAGCIARDASKGCATGRAVGGPDGLGAINGRISGRRIVVSGDGTRVYVATAEGVAVFARSPVDGSLSQLPGAAGCVSSNADSGCAQARALGGVGAIALSPDGSTLYATTGSKAVAVLERDRATQGLAQPEGQAGCVNATGADGCMAVASLTVPFAVAVSPDNRHVYVGSSTGTLFGFTR